MPAAMTHALLFGINIKAAMRLIAAAYCCNNFSALL
jgi:hypothetical protein